MCTPSRLARSPQTGLLGLLGLLAAGGCNFEVPSASYLRETTLVAAVVEVTELGPLNPERVGPTSAAPIAEAMPGDTLTFDAYVVDREGARVPADALTSVWFQCGPFDCGEGLVDPSFPQFELDCASLAAEGQVWDLDAICRLGGGDGRFAFEVPPLGQLMVESRVASFYGVIGWDGRPAADCWAARRARDRSLDRCGFVQRSVRIGPSWWMLAYAETLGLISPIPIPEIPLPAYLQPANRVPLGRFGVYVDGVELGVWPDQDTFAVQPGDRIEIQTDYDEGSQLLQSYLLALFPDEGEDDFTFVATAELLGERVLSSNAIVLLEPDFADTGIQYPERWELVVDEYAEPGRSRVLLHYFDDRYAEGVASLVFEVTR